MKFNNCLLILVLLFHGCTIPETLYITNNTDDICIITIKLALRDGNLKDIKKNQPYLNFSTNPRLQSKDDFNIAARYNKKLEYNVVDDRSIEIHLPAKSGIYFTYSLATPSTIDSIYFNGKNKDVVFNRKTFRRSLEKPANNHYGYLYVFKD